MRHSPLPLLMLAFVVALAACGDEVTDPDQLLDAAEAEAVLRSAEALPLLPTLLDDLPALPERDRATLVRARELWSAGVAVDEPDGPLRGVTRAGARRRIATAHALPVLLEHTPPERWVVARERTEAWMATAAGMLEHLTMRPVERSLAAAASELLRSDRATNERDRVYHLLLAGSELVETTPRYVARTLSLEAAGALEDAWSEGVLPEATLERAERLKEWSATAVAEGDYLLAIQRAYYAIQLVSSP